MKEWRREREEMRRKIKKGGEKERRNMRNGN